MDVRKNRTPTPCNSVLGQVDVFTSPSPHYLLSSSPRTSSSSLLLPPRRSHIHPHPNLRLHPHPHLQRYSCIHPRPPGISFAAEQLPVSRQLHPANYFPFAGPRCGHMQYSIKWKEKHEIGLWPRGFDIGMALKLELTVKVFVSNILRGSFYNINICSRHMQISRSGLNRQAWSGALT